LRASVRLSFMLKKVRLAGFGEFIPIVQIGNAFGEPLRASPMGDHAEKQGQAHETLVDPTPPWAPIYGPQAGIFKPRRTGRTAGIF